MAASSRAPSASSSSSSSLEASSARCNASVHVALKSFCPSAIWQDRVTPLLTTANMTLIVIGANKGYAAIAFLSRYLPASRWNVDVRTWQTAQRVDCGVCRACNAVIRRPRIRGRHATNATVLAVELIGDTARRLQRGFRRFGVPGVAVHAAVGAVPGIGYEPTISNVTNFDGRPMALGGSFVPEHYGLTKAKYGHQVRVTTVDALHAAHGLGVVDQLSIDTEGNDANVLDGANGLFERGLVRLVEFEYHHTGAWKTRKLSVTLDKLHRHGFTCFWQGNSRYGMLGEYLDGCDYEHAPWGRNQRIGRMSNLVCAREERVVGRLRSLVARPRNSSHSRGPACVSNTRNQNGAVTWQCRL